MKITLTLIILSLSALFCNSVLTPQYPVYSMVFSCKIQTSRASAEKRIFFFAVPFTFNSQMYCSESSNALKISFDNADNDIYNFKIIKDQAKAVSNSVFRDMVSFSSDYKTLTITFDNNQFTRVNERIYQNKDFKNIQYKFSSKSSSTGQVLYITWDLQKATNKEEDVNSLIDYLRLQCPAEQTKELKFLE